ncbi:DUF11 domain-containing protein [Nonomuraea soli]|uniref:DUF11 domain-containing protein n=1 Tax=Nonomuraea soli TaxID=1032476 RepID=A0A7W0CHK9_9ACTN|nr:DUF11 domain-containing protein [Nonomuraea soli]MBA2891342.1 hypothetical protein [Nonomuraea soli]
MIIVRTTMGALLAAALVATVTVTAPANAETTVVQNDPYSHFKVKVSYTKAVKRGGKITYRIRATNTGPHYADYFWIGGKLPGGIKDRLSWWGPKGTECEWDDYGFWCWTPDILEVGDTEWLDVQVTLKSNTKNSYKAQLGILSYDVPTGADDLEESELKRIGIKGWYWLKTAKTKIVWPRPSKPWTPPRDTWTPPPAAPSKGQNDKKGT